MFQDWQLGREVSQLQSESNARQRRLEQASLVRLDNGCDHDFDTGAYGLPEGVCRKCGLAREKPTGPCDHVWRVKAGAVPGSVCDKCGKTHATTSQPKSLA
jgi:hypothetical protein